MAKLPKFFAYFAAALMSVSAYSGDLNSNSKPVDFANVRMGTRNSRFYYFVSAARPEGMIQLSPDTKPEGTWRAGYIYVIDEIRCFSHIHSWQISGLPVMPFTGNLGEYKGFESLKDKFSHDDEVAKLGHHKVFLQNQKTTVELTATSRVGFHKYTFSPEKEPFLMFDLASELGQSKPEFSHMERIDDNKIQGFVRMSGQMRRKNPFTVYFTLEFNRPIAEVWGCNSDRFNFEKVEDVSGKGASFYVKFAPSKEPLLMKAGISFTSIEGSQKNLNAELPDWDFEKAVANAAENWNDVLGKIKVYSSNINNVRRFYSDLARAFHRSAINDADGKYPDNIGKKTVIRQLPLDKSGKPKFNSINCDAHWGSEFSLSALWSLAWPKTLSDNINSLIDYYPRGGMIARGPSGGNYTFVMVGDQAIPLIAAAYNKNIRDFDVKTAYEGCIKNSEIGGIRDHTGYEVPAGPYMKYYIERGYVPEGIKRPSASHLQGCALTLNFAFEDWCMAQFALATNHKADYEKYLKRSKNYKNVFDKDTGYMRPRNLKGEFMGGSDWKPVVEHKKGEKKLFTQQGFVESNSAIMTYYVMHDFEGLAELMGGKDKLIEKLNGQFEKAKSSRFLNRGSLADPWVDYSNEPGMAMAHVFAYLGAYDLAQYWVRQVKDTIYPADKVDAINNAYNGDEDDGVGGALVSLMAIGLFDAQGGANIDPEYIITAPVFDKVEIQLDNRYYKGKTFTIIAKNNKKGNVYIASAKLNGKLLKEPKLKHKDFANGGVLELELTNVPVKTLR